MKNLKRSLAAILACTVLFCLSSCKKEETEPVVAVKTTTETTTAKEPETELTTAEETTAPTTSATAATTAKTQSKNTTAKKSNDKTPEPAKSVNTPPDDKEQTPPDNPTPKNELVGKWSITENININDFIEEDLGVALSVPLKLQTYVTYNENGTYTSQGAFLNRDEFEQAFIQAFPEAAADESFQQYVHSLLDNLESQIAQSNGTYRIDGSTVYYDEGTNDAISETFSVSGNTLTLSGNYEGTPYSEVYTRA